MIIDIINNWIIAQESTIRKDYSLGKIQSKRREKNTAESFPLYCLVHLEFANDYQNVKEDPMSKENP